MGLGRNLIILLTHGLRSDALDDSQSWPLPTTHFQQLSQRGIRLTATSACPADPGGMVSLLTGLQPRQHGHLHQLRPSRPPSHMVASGAHSSHAATPAPASVIYCDGWPATLMDAGYHVVGVGCLGPIEPWCHETVLVEDVDSPRHQTCAYLSSTRSKGITAAILQQRRQRQRYGPFDPDRLLIEPTDDIDGFIAAEARKTLTRMPTDKPWALVVMFSGPGNNLPPPTLYEGVVDPAGLTHGFTPADFRIVNALAELDYPRILLQRLEPYQVGRIRADYLGRVSLLDHGLGRLISAAEDRPDYDRTWTVLSSDRGQLLGENGLVGHRSFLSGAIDVPVIIASPGPTSQKNPDDPGLISTVDVAATIASLAGCDRPNFVAGRSLLPILTGDPIDAPPCVACISEFGHRLLLKTERYKVVFDTESHEAIGLYDLSNDPHEQSNLIGSVVGKNILYALRWRLGNALMSLRAVPGAADQSTHHEW